jgi:hypothetical protein
MYNNKSYYKHRNNSNFVYWRCVQALKEAKCKGSVKISGLEVVISETEHSGHEALEAKEISVLKFKVVLKERCQNDSVTAVKIYSEEQSKLAKQFNFTNADLAKYAPSYRRMASCLQKQIESELRGRRNFQALGQQHICVITFPLRPRGRSVSVLFGYQARHVES